MLTYCYWRVQTYYVKLLLLQLGHRSENVLVDGYSANAIMKVGNTIMKV